ncbi:virulence factor SrfC family protein [Gelidibacter maritimus]|uniref:Virulence factor n=1 Tax=Gelidibacter maritimus TaxID=2761487 RepID=A0A7W2M2H2_9FLAO|nr:virulence factor SrfC family protein [Gelidibacter maritimus]MBA6151519.1 hypothetical protein [Gelidibacter maritimus]
MVTNIQKQLEIIENSNKWIRTYLDGEKQNTAYRTMVDFRRKLKKKKFALENNPAAAVYGESQVGKSYLISSLLSEEGKPFSIAGENENVHNFIEDINPIGDGSESTSLVSRFSVNYKPINREFPIKATLLSPADIALVLCDSYYNDCKADHSLILKMETINSEIDSLKARLIDVQTQQGVFGEDDVLDMQDYFKENFATKASNILFSYFFEEVSLFISKLRPNEWIDIVSILWNKNEKFNFLFSSLISEYEKLNFTNTIYLPIESVLRKYGTLLDVQRLKEIYASPSNIETEYKATTTALIIDKGQERQVSFKKSYLCALTAELVFQQEESLLKSKPFLKETDLLDFPGARARMTLAEEMLSEKNIPDLLIRGKVAYLFNKYSNAEKISIFMLCAKHEQAAQRSMPEMLNNWIEKFIGNTEDKREKFISTSKISPLFIIGTFFNENLRFNSNHDKKDDLTSLKNRWLQRFDNTLSIELLNTKTHRWFNSWTKSSPDFRNIFLLRDFVYSESHSQVFKGFSEHGKELEEIKPPSYPDFRQKLRQSFIDYDFVKRHFANPEESWDEAASINKDGTQLIIDKLTIAAENINNARLEKIIDELNEISLVIVSELLKYFHSNDKDEELQKAKSIAGDIQFKLDTAFRADGIKLYGKLKNELLLNEGKVLELFRKKISSIEHRDVVNMNIYSTYKQRVPVIENDSPDMYFDRLCTHYEKTSEEDILKFRSELEENKVNLEELITGNSELIKNNAQQLADTLLDYWFAYINQNDKNIVQQVLAQNGSSALQDITDMYQKLFKKVDIAQKIAEKIRKHLEGQNKSDLPYDMVADMSTELLNKCIRTVGFEYFDDSEIYDLKQANEKNNLGLILDYNENPTENSVAELFDKIENWTDIIQNNPEEMKSLPSYRSYLSWSNHLKAGFISVCDIPTYDVQANENLGTIIKESETFRY